MDYQLATELKEAGFPLQECEFKNCTYTGDSLDESGKNYHYPTLEELIEAIGKDFARLVHHPLESKWRAIAYSAHHMDHWGTTPTEAVANLYLALRKVNSPSPKNTDEPAAT